MLAYGRWDAVSGIGQTARGMAWQCLSDDDFRMCGSWFLGLVKPRGPCFDGWCALISRLMIDLQESGRLRRVGLSVEALVGGLRT